MQIFVTHLLLSVVTLTTCSYVAGVNYQDEGVARELFLLDTNRPGVPTSPEYLQQGYTSDHNSTCDYRLYGTAPNRAAGDAAMQKLSSIFKTQFNNAIQKIAEGAYDADSNNPNTRSLVTENQKKIKIVQTEIIIQQARFITDGLGAGTIGTIAGDVAGTTRKLSSSADVSADSSADSSADAAGGVERKLYWGAYSYGLILGYWICKSCGTDNRDGRRLLGQNRLAQADFATAVLEDLANSEFAFFTEAVENANCFLVSCDAGEWVGTEGCSSITTVISNPLETESCVSNKLSVSDYGIDSGCQPDTPNCVNGNCEAVNAMCPNTEAFCDESLGCILSDAVSIGAGACSGTSGCNRAEATIGAASCLGSDACWDSDGLIGAASCLGDCACSNLKAGASIGARSCIGATACPFADSFIGADSCVGESACAGTTAATGAASCLGASSCLGAAGIIGIGSCIGEFTCASLGTAARIGAGSCNAETACAEANGVIGAGSCNGEGACEGSNSSIGAASCNANDACQGSEGSIGASSCVGVGSCVGASADIGAGSCTTAETCVSAAGVIGIGSCTGKGSCMGTKADFNVAAGSCTGKNSCLNASGNILAGTCTTADSCSS